MKLLNLSKILSLPVEVMALLISARRRGYQVYDDHSHYIIKENDIIREKIEK